MNTPVVILCPEAVGASDSSADSPDPDRGYRRADAIDWRRRSGVRVDRAWNDSSRVVPDLSGAASGHAGAAFDGKIVDAMAISPA